MSSDRMALCGELRKLRLKQHKHLTAMITGGCDLQLNSDSFNELKEREGEVLALLGSEADNCFLSNL